MEVIWPRPLMEELSAMRAHTITGDEKKRKHHLYQQRGLSHITVCIALKSELGSG